MEGRVGGEAKKNTATSLKTFSCLVLQGRDPKFLSKYPSKWWIFHGYVSLPECNPGNPAPVNSGHYKPQKNLGPQNGVQHPQIPYKKLIKIHVVLLVSKKLGSKKNSLQSKTLKPFGLLQRMAQKPPLLFLLRTLSSKSSNSGGGGKDLPHVHVNHLRSLSTDLQGYPPNAMFPARK